MVVADRFPNFSICGLPYHVAGEVPDWRRLAHRSVEDLQATGMRLLLDHTAHRIDPATRRVTVTDPSGHKHALDYDRLIVGTGADPAMTPPTSTKRVLFICTTTKLLASADLVITMSRQPTGPTLPGASAGRLHWQLRFPGDDLDAMRPFCDEVDRRPERLA